MLILLGLLLLLLLLKPLLLLKQLLTLSLLLKFGPSSPGRLNIGDGDIFVISKEIYSPAFTADPRDPLTAEKFDRTGFLMIIISGLLSVAVLSQF